MAERRPLTGARAARVAVALAAWGVCLRGAAAADARGEVAAPMVFEGGPWSRAEREAVAAALRPLPAAVLARAPRAIVRGGVACAGRGWGVEPGWPADDQLVDGAGRLQLCAPPPGTTAADTGRQVALALLYAFDRAAGWSDDPAWRRLSRWSRPLASGFAPRAENQDPAGFASARGRRSPGWDLATFMAALLRDDQRDDDGGGIGCRLISQATFVRARLQAAGAPLPPAHCPAFERWAELDRLAAIEVVLAAPSTAMIGSLFGHVLLRLVYRDEAGETPLHLSRTVAFLADNDTPFVDDPAYALKGIVGFYTASLHERSFLDAYREYVVLEGRDLRRWRLDLTAAERRALMERLWTVAGGARYSYTFFRRNCATLMVDLLDDIRPPGQAVGVPGLLAAPPASTLEPWERARGAGGGPLLIFVPEPLLSFDHQARLASRRRGQLEARMVAALPPAAGAALVPAFRDAHAATPGLRASAYQRLALLLAEAGATNAADVYLWLRDSAAIESHLSTVANLEAEARADRARRGRVGAAVQSVAARLEADARGLGVAPGPASALGARLTVAVRNVSASDGAVRLDGYRALGDLARELTREPRGDDDLVARLRLLALLQSEARYDVGRMTGVAGLREALLFPEPGRTIDQQPYLRGREELLRLPLETRVSVPLRALQRAKQELFAARDLAPAAAALVGADQDAVAVTAAARREYQASLPRSGIDQLAVLAGVAAGRGPASAGAPTAGLVLAGALYDERLGDHRRFGFPSDTALVVARSAALLTPTAGLPAVAAYDARLVGYRSLRAPLPESGAGSAPFGWELALDMRGSRARALATEVAAGWGLLAPIVERAELADHLLAAAGLSVHGAVPTTGAAVGAGARAALGAPFGLELRAGLGVAPRYRSWLGARVWAEPMALLVGAPARLAVQEGVTIEAHVALCARPPGGAHDPALLVRGDLLRTPLTFTGAGSATEAMLALGVELR